MSDGRVVAVIVALGLLYFGWHVDFLLTGDPAMYADYVAQRRFDELTLHFGFYAVMTAVDATVGRWFGVPLHESMVWINVAAGALSLGVAYLLARDLLGTRRDALLVALLLAVCGRMLVNATTSEIYTLQTLLTLSAYLLYGRDRAAWAGALAGAAVLVSPLSVFAFLYFPVCDAMYSRRLRWDRLLPLAGVALVVYLPFFVFNWRELFWGHRGLLNVNAGVPFDPAAVVRYLPRYQFKHYTLLVLLVPPALLAARAHARLLALSLAVAVPHLYVISKLTLEDHVFILTTDFFFCCWLALGWRRLERGRVTRWVPPLLLAAHAALFSAAGMLGRVAHNRAFAAELRAVARDRLIGRDATLISDWNGIMTLTYFGRPAVTTTIEREPLFRQMYDITAISRMDPRLLEARELWVLESWQPGKLYRLFASPEARAAQWADNAIVALARRDLKLDCVPAQPGTYPVFRCARAAAATTTR